MLRDMNQQCLMIYIILLLLLWWWCVSVCACVQASVHVHACRFLTSFNLLVWDFFPYIFLGVFNLLILAISSVGLDLWIVIS